MLRGHFIDYQKKVRLRSTHFSQHATTLNRKLSKNTQPQDVFSFVQKTKIVFFVTRTAVSYRVQKVYSGGIRFPWLIAIDFVYSAIFAIYPTCAKLFFEKQNKQASFLVTNLSSCLFKCSFCYISL